MPQTVDAIWGFTPSQSCTIICEDHQQSDGHIWDAANTILALAAIAVTLYQAHRSRKNAAYDEEYGNLIISGCNDIRKFMDQVAIAANLPNPTDRTLKADQLMDELNGFIHPLQNALMYADENLSGISKPWSDLAVDLTDEISEVLTLLSGVSNANWLSRLNTKRGSINKLISKILRVSQQRRKKF